MRAGRLFASPLLAAGRGVEQASVGDASAPVAADRSRDASIELRRTARAGRSVRPSRPLPVVIDIRRLPPGTRPARLSLDVMVAPDGAGEKAVVSAFVNERLLGSTVAATGEATHLDLPLPDGLIGTIANVRVLIERDSAQGDCRFEPQGYPAQILGSSALIAHERGRPTARFLRSDLALSHSGSRFCCRQPPPISPIAMLGMVAEVATQLSPDTRAARR